MFTSRPPDRATFPVVPAAIAGVVVLLAAGAAILYGRHSSTKPANQLQPLDSHAPSLPISNVEMSESTSLSGGKSTFIDGHIRNNDTAPLTGATVQVLFANDSGQGPEVETLPLTLIRTHQPYIDIEPVSADPIAPGQEREFRLIFESVDPAWNQSVPEIHVIQTQYR